MDNVHEISPDRPHLSTGRGPLQPLLHHLVSCVRAPGLVLSAADGQLRDHGVQGWFQADRRALSGLVVTVGGEEPEAVGREVSGASAASFTGVVRRLGDPHADPTVLVDRRRVLDGDGLVERVAVSSEAQTPVDAVLRVQVTTDLAPMAAVRVGVTSPPVGAVAVAGGLRFAAEGSIVTLRTEPAPDVVDPATGGLGWRRTLHHGDTLQVTLRATCRTEVTAPFAARTCTPLARPTVECPDPRLPRLVAQGVDDVEGLLLTDQAGDHFVGAGSPWFLTLFGRDSLWAARMLLPLGTELALSTLRVLARRQGRHDRVGTEEQPGKILHEVRAEATTLEHSTLPPVYYGTVDATPLFVVLLAEAWRWGADPVQVRALLPAAEAALRWCERAAGPGFLRYVDGGGTGLDNQGWKDSHDAIQWSDGRLADPPIALCEAQAYAHQAAVLGADLFEAFGHGDAAHWRRWAGRLADRFRAAYWVGERADAYPAVALDGAGRPVDSVTSNLGHLLGTGLLTADESDRVARRLAAPPLSGGFGLRTLTADSPRFGRLSYHGGAVWPHDTAIAATGLARAGHADTAAGLLEGLVLAAPAFDYRLPELFGGDARTRAAPTAYPAACRPQAWSAAAPLAALCAVLGIEPDVPTGVVRVRGPGGPLPFGPVRLRGLVVGTARLDVAVDDAGDVTASSTDPALDIALP